MKWSQRRGEQPRFTSLSVPAKSTFRIAGQDPKDLEGRPRILSSCRMTREGRAVPGRRGRDAQALSSRLVSRGC